MRLVPQQPSARLVDLAETPQPATLTSTEDGWHDIRLAHEFKCLSYLVGPGVTLDKLWEEARAKWLKRTRQLGATLVSPVVTMRAYKERCLPTLNYIAQVAPFPKEGKRDDLEAFAALFRTPHFAYPRALVHELLALGLPHLHPAHLTCEAAHIRDAVQAEDIWRAAAHDGGLLTSCTGLRHLCGARLELTGVGLPPGRGVEARRQAPRWRTRRGRARAPTVGATRGK